MKLILRALCAAAIAFGASGALAQWPERPVRFIIPASAGSAPEIVARFVGEKLTAMWGGRPVVIDPRVGGNTQIGVDAAAKSAPDGYTFLFTHAAALTIVPYTTKVLPYNIERDFEPVVYIGSSPMMIAVHPSVPASNLRELVALVKAQPGKLNYGTSSTRNVPHLTGELLKSTAGLDLPHVPYKGSAQALQDAIGGQVEIMIDGITALVASTKGGRLRPIAVTSLQRFPSLPDVPAVAEFYPGFEVTGWFAIMAPTKTPRPVVERLNRDVNTVLAMPETVARLAQFGAVPVGGSIQDLARTLQREREVFAKIFRDAKIEPE